MSLLTPVPGCAQASIQSTVAGRQVETSIWCEKIVPPVTDGAVNNLAFRVAVLAGIARGSKSNDYFFRQVSARSFDSGPGIPQVRTFNAGPGLQPTSAKVASIALRLFNHVSPERLSHHSTNYLPGVPSGQVVGNTISTAWADGEALTWTNFIVNLPIFGWRFVAVQRVVGGVVLAMPIIKPVVDVTVYSYTVASLRMRLNTR